MCLAGDEAQTTVLALACPHHTLVLSGERRYFDVLNGMAKKSPPSITLRDEAIDFDRRNRLDGFYGRGYPWLVQDSHLFHGFCPFDLPWACVFRWGFLVHGGNVKIGGLGWTSHRAHKRKSRAREGCQVQGRPNGVASSYEPRTEHD